MSEARGEVHLVHGQSWLEQPWSEGINYTGQLTRLMHDVIARVPALNFIDLSRVLVFARPGRSSADGAVRELPQSRPANE